MSAKFNPINLLGWFYNLTNPDSVSENPTQTKTRDFETGFVVKIS